MKSLVFKLSRCRPLTLQTLNGIRPLYSDESPRPNTIPERFVISLPTKVQPYAKLLRLDKPIGTYLLFWPGAWSIALAAPAFPDGLRLMGLFTVGSVLMRGSGCIINDMWDSDIDKKVERTKTRPLPAGDLTRFQALCFLGGTLSLALYVLMQLNILGVLCMPIVAVYPYMKRITDYPQLCLGIVMNWGAVMGWSAVHGSLSFAAVVPLYLGGVCWTMYYDTIYAHQDKIDDRKIGIRSTALKLGNEKSRHLLRTMIPTLTLGIVSSALGSSWVHHGTVDPSLVQMWALACIGALGAHKFYSVSKLDLDSPSACLTAFQSERHYGAAVFALLTVYSLF